MKISIITSCKGRLHHLRESLPHMLAQHTFAGLSFDVILVDYLCPDNAFEWATSLGDPRLRCIRVLDNSEEWSVQRAKNIGANLSDAELLAFVDADCTRPPPYYAIANWHEMESRDLAMLEWGIPVPNGQVATNGTFTVRARDFHALHGFDESLSGWGYNDVEFKNRLRASGRKWLAIPFVLMHTPHDDTERVQFCREKNKDASCAANRDRQSNYNRPINPTGYGITSRYELHNANPGVLAGRILP